MNKDDYFYITTTLPYVNADPHIGFAREIVEADVIARYQRQLSKNVFFNTGSDEHGQKIYQKAQAAQLSTQEYCDQYAAKFADLKQLLNLSYDNFIRTTDPIHIKAAQEFWQKSSDNNDIYLANYKTKYCVGCEMEKTDSELVDGRCPLHPNLDLEIRQEPNYFFRFSKYQQPLLDFYRQHPNFVKPQEKMNEILSFVKKGLKDFSISRLKEKMPWGIPIPNDSNHVMYVWFDALISYISTLGWPDNQNKFDQYWPGVQVAGKDNLRQQAAMWQAMLMSAGLPNSRQILINGFISIDGQKMSKSLGNVIRPQDMIDRYGIDASRYLLISLGDFGQDLDVNWDKLNTRYQARLSNGLGNLCSRVAKMSQTADLNYAPEKHKSNQEFQALMNQYQLSAGLDWIDQQVTATDQFLSESKPWNLNTDQKLPILQKAIDKIQVITRHLQPFMPETAQTISSHFQGQVQALSPLFPRVN